MPANASPPPLNDTVAARVAEQLRAEVLSGVLAPGTPLRQNEVARRLGVSSTPVREAFLVLERLGLVQREDRRGVRVFRPSVEDLVQSYEVRGVLEAHAARLAARRLRPGDLEPLEDVLRAMAEPSLSRDDFLVLNSTFHTTIAGLAGNERLARLIADEQVTTATYVHFLAVDPGGRQDARAEHHAVLAALRARDGEAAAAAMQAHLAVRSLTFQGRPPG